MMRGPLRTDGAPNDQGLAQARSLGTAIRAELARARRAHGALGWRSALARAGRGPGRALARFLPQQHERLCGIAVGLGADWRALQLIDSATRLEGVAFAEPGRLQAVFEVPAPLAASLTLRVSQPDAGGFPSVEWTAAPLAGCLAGVSERGIAVVCCEDRCGAEPSLRFAAQELLFRASDLDGGIEHLRRRCAYLGGSGRLVAADARGDVRELELRGGELRVREFAGPGQVTRPSVEIDCAKRRLRWHAPDGGHEAEAPEALPERTA